MEQLKRSGRLTELELAQRQTRRLERKAKDLANSIIVFLHLLDEEMKKPSTVERGRRIAKMSNWLDSKNDSMRFGLLGVNFRTDDKDRIANRIIAQMKKESVATASYLKSL
jgi:hypothetical protein